MPYSGDPEGVARDAVRLLVGDISTAASGEFLDDADYDFFISQSSNRFISAQIAANALAAKFTGAAASASGDGYLEKSVGDLKIKKADAIGAAREYRSMASMYGRNAAAGIAPFSGGLSISDKATVGADADRARPAFVSRLFDNDGATDFATGSASS